MIHPKPTTHEVEHDCHLDGQPVPAPSRQPVPAPSRYCLAVCYCGDCPTTNPFDAPATETTSATRPHPRRLTRHGPSERTRRGSTSCEATVRVLRREDHAGPEDRQRSCPSMITTSSPSQAASRSCWQRNRRHGRRSTTSTTCSSTSGASYGSDPQSSHTSPC